MTPLEDFARPACWKERSTWKVHGVRGVGRVLKRRLVQREHRIPAESRRLLAHAAQRLVKLYEATGQTAKAAERKDKLAQMQAP